MAALPHATPASHPQTVPDYPIDAGDGGCDCSQPTTNGRTWVSETDLITIAPQDALIDGNDGGSLYNIVAAKGIKHLLYAGVATNMCVMARHTAIVAAKTWGLEPILIRDLTDTMSAFPSATTVPTHPCSPARLRVCPRRRYNPERLPYLADHDAGTELFVQFLEKQQLGAANWTGVPTISRFDLMTHEGNVAP